MERHAAVDTTQRTQQEADVVKWCFNVLSECKIYNNVNMPTTCMSPDDWQYPDMDRLYEEWSQHQRIIDEMPNIAKGERSA
jgi:hypothetical protein